MNEHTGYLAEGFNSQFAQVLADRAFDTIEKVLYGKAKNVRFKGKWDNILLSINSKQTATGFFFDTDTLSVTYRSLTIPLSLSTGTTIAITNGICNRSPGTSKSMRPSIYLIFE